MRLPLLVILLLAALSASAEVILPNALSDHAVLQRGVPVHVWGWATPGENVTIHFHDQNVAALTDRYGSWQAWLKPEKAGGPYTLLVAGDASTAPLKRDDILVGEVWVASGQSNMEFELRGRPQSPGGQHPEVLSAASHMQIRMLHTAHRVSAVPLADIRETWTVCTPETATTSSAVAYWFALQLREHENVPVGIVQATWGGTPAHSWISNKGLADAKLQSVFADASDIAIEQGRADRLRAQWAMEADRMRAAGKQPPQQGDVPNDHGGSWAPATLFNAMIAPLTPYTIRGVIWYQGETDAAPSRAPYYRQVFPALIQDWRKQWAQGDFPFLFVQISNWKTTADWGSVRDAQRHTLALRNTAMAVTLDVGTPNNIHPPDKKTVGDRLALAARVIVYEEPGLEFSGPQFECATIEGNAMRVWFTHAEGLTANSMDLGDFEVADENGKWFAASAKIDGNTIIASAPSVASPHAVRYAWAGEVDHYFYNKAGLPAGTFTSSP